MAKTPDGWLLVVLQPENLARMKAGDPVTISEPDLGLMICFESIPHRELVKKLSQGDPRPYLTRGWQNHPDDYTEPIKLMDDSGKGV